MKRCLLLGCTKAKNEGANLTAIGRYDGPAFRVLRRFFREADQSLLDVDVFVISAKYGLINGQESIGDYDQLMTREIAKKINPIVISRLEYILNEGYSELFITMGKVYLESLRGFEKIVPQSIKIVISKTSQGKRLSELKRWLYRSSGNKHTPTISPKMSGKATLKGRPIKASKEDVIKVAKEALAMRKGEPTHFRSWYVKIEGKRVSTKWLVSLLSGLPVSEFQASDARRVLAQLGIPVHHV
jgi:hypothetical protein